MNRRELLGLATLVPAVIIADRVIKRPSLKEIKARKEAAYLDYIEATRESPGCLKDDMHL